jgi:exonuclease VII small subunit
VCVAFGELKHRPPTHIQARRKVVVATGGNGLGLPRRRAAAAQVDPLRRRGALARFARAPADWAAVKCTGDRLPKDRLEAAVLTQLAALYRDGHLIQQALADVARHTETERPRLEEQLASTRADIGRLETKLERYFEAFEDGQLSAELCQERIRGHRTRLEALRDQEADLPRGSAHKPTRRPTRPH